MKHKSDGAEGEISEEKATAAWLEVAKRRRQEVIDGIVKCRPCDELIAEARKKLRKNRKK